MGKRAWGSILVLMLALAWSAHADDKVAPSITTSDGKVFTNVKVLRVEGDRVLLLNSGGGAWIALDSLSDDARKSLGLRTRAEQAAFDAEQAQKEVVKLGNDSASSADKASPQNEEIEALLKQGVKGVSMPRIQLPEAVAMLKQGIAKNVNFILDPDPALNIPAMSTPVLNLRDTTLGKALQAMLRPNKLDFTISHGAIYISSPEGCIREAGAAMKKEVDDLVARAAAPPTIPDQAKPEQKSSGTPAIRAPRAPTLMLPNATDADLAALKDNQDLRVLILRGSNVTDAGLAYLKGITGLNALNLTDTQVTDAGLAYLKEMKGMRILWLTGTKVTDAGLADLKAALPGTHIVK